MQKCWKAKRNPDKKIVEWYLTCLSMGLLIVQEKLYLLFVYMDEMK